MGQQGGSGGPKGAYRAGARGSFTPLPAELRELVSRSSGSVLLESSRGGVEGAASYLFLNPLREFAARQMSDLPGMFAEIEAARAEGLYAAGYLGYECGYHFEPAATGGRAWVGEVGLPLAWFGFYRDPLVFHHGAGWPDGAGRPDGGVRPQRPGRDHAAGQDAAMVRDRVTGREGATGREAATGARWGEGATEPLRSGAERAREAEVGESFEIDLSAEAYAGQVARVKRWIEAGDTYQVNLTTRLRMPAPRDAAAMFGRMMAAQPVEFGAYLNLRESQILSASPELFFRRDGERVEMRPMKGTAERGRTTEEDAERALSLAGDAKNRAENVMIVDLLRSDLGRVCRLGSVRAEDLFTVERYPTVLQMVSTVRGLLRPGVSEYDLFRAVFPSGSIVGAPKIRTMQIVREMEGRDRGVYTGAIGFFAPGGRATFSVAIRTVVVEGERAEMGVGSGVVYDSDAAAEFGECRSKARFLEEPATEFRLLETLLWEEGGYVLLEEHMERLAGSAEYFDFRMEVEEVRAALLRVVETLEAGSGWRVRLLLARDGAVEVSSGELRREEGTAEVRVRLARERMRSGDVFLRHKTTRREPYDRAYREAVGEGFTDAIFLNERGEVTEGAIHNVVVVSEGIWRTPPVSAGVLPGVFRAELLRSGRVCEGTVTLPELLAAEAVYLCNSVRGLRRVGEIVGGEGGAGEE